MKRNNKPLSPAEKDDWPPLPLPDNYKNASDPKFSTDLYNAVRRYRLVFYEPGLPINAGQYKAAFDSCLDIRQEFPELKEVPTAKNPYSPNEYDFIALEQWLVTAIEYIQNYYYAELGEPTTQGKPDAEKAIGNISGMRWQDAQKKAEEIVDESGWKGFEKLRVAVGCSKKTLRKAVDNSDKLTKEETKYKASPGTLKAVGLTSKVLTTYKKTADENLPSETETNEILDELLRQTQREKPEMLEQTKKELEEMDPESRQKLASACKNIKLKEPNTHRQHKEV